MGRSKINKQILLLNPIIKKSMFLFVVIILYLLFFIFVMSLMFVVYCYIKLLNI